MQIHLFVDTINETADLFRSLNIRSNIYDLNIFLHLFENEVCFGYFYAAIGL